MLYRPEAFEPLVDEPWDEARVREAIRTIVADTDQAFDPDGLWPAHEWDVWELAPAVDRPLRRRGGRRLGARRACAAAVTPRRLST